MIQTSTGTSSNGSVSMSSVIVHLDSCVVAEKASELCRTALAECPNGSIPIQTVYEMLLRMVDREDIIDAMRADGEVAS